MTESSVASRIATETQDAGFIWQFTWTFEQITLYLFYLHPLLGAEEVSQ
jgi:hypothetical protein